MTQKEKIELLKETIRQLYEKEGRTFSYISKLLKVDRKVLTYSIREWEMKQANISYMTPSNQKFMNKHKLLIKSRLDNDIPITKIAEELGVSRFYLGYLIPKNEVTNKAKIDYLNRITEGHKTNVQQAMDNSKLNYDAEEIDGEEWKEILGYDGYYISNMGRVRRFVSSYQRWVYLTPYPNKVNSSRYYISLPDNKGKRHNLFVHRLVGFAFVNGNTEEHNVINHIDGNPLNNKSTNLEWVTSSENSIHAFRELKRTTGRRYSKNSRFKKIIVDGKFEFKTIEACAKFYKVSPTQMQRYISKEAQWNHTIKFIY